MDLNIELLIIVGLLLVALVVFLIVRNQKDEKEVEGNLNSDLGRPDRHDYDHDAV